MRHHQVLILVYLVGVFRAEACFRRKRKFGHAVVEFFLGCRHFPSDARIPLYGLVGDWSLPLIYINYFGEVTFARLFNRWCITLVNLI